MTRLERRVAMPIVTAFVDRMRKDFPDLTILRAEENGHTWGEAQPEGVQPVLAPVSRGGPNSDANVQLLTVSCNRSKGAKTMTEFMGCRTPDAP